MTSALFAVMQFFGTPIARAESLTSPQLTESYKKDVEPILQRACLNCHGQARNLPWYASLPIAKQLIESDQREAKNAIDMTTFPFVGKGTTEELVGALRDDIEDKSMPPIRYRFFHPESALSENEKAVIFGWIDRVEGH